MDYIKDDFNTVTADDYTVNVDFSDNEMFNKFYTDPDNREAIHSKYKGSAVAAFREYIIENLPIKMSGDDMIIYEKYDDDPKNWT